MSFINPINYLGVSCKSFSLYTLEKTTSSVMLVGILDDKGKQDGYHR